MDDNSTSEDENNDYFEMQEALEKLEAKNAELRQNINYLKIENLSYKQRYQSLKQNLTNLSHLLQENVQIYSELYDDTRSALEIARVSMLASPNVRKESSHTIGAVANENEIQSSKNIERIASENSRDELDLKKKTAVIQKTQDDNVKTTASTSNVNLQINRRKILPIEPINMQEVENKMNEVEDLRKNEHFNESDISDRLTTIMEENSTSKSLEKDTLRSIDVNFSRRVSVQLTRLSSTIVNQHLKKSNLSITNNSSVTDLDISARSDPTFTSTPLTQFDVMRSLGLMPSPKTNHQSNNFVNIRKRSRRNVLPELENVSLKKERISLVSPKKENAGSSKENCSPESNKFSRNTTKRKNESPVSVPKKHKKFEQKVEETRSGRLPRKAKPTILKEMSSKKKLRRS